MPSSECSEAKVALDLAAFDLEYSCATRKSHVPRHARNPSVDTTDLGIDVELRVGHRLADDARGVDELAVRGVEPGVLQPRVALVLALLGEDEAREQRDDLRAARSGEYTRSP